jgi:hypothetical protein
MTYGDNVLSYELTDTVIIVGNGISSALSPCMATQGGEHRTLRHYTAPVAGGQGTAPQSRTR